MTQQSQNTTFDGSGNEPLTGFDAFCGEVFWEESRQHRSPPLPFAGLNAAKLVSKFLEELNVRCQGTSSLAVLGVVYLLDRVGSGQPGVAGYVGDTLLLINMAAAAILTQYERKRGVVTSSVAFIFWCIKLVMDIIPLYSFIMLQLYDTNVFRFVIFVLMYLLTLTMVVLYSFAEGTPTSKRGYKTLGSTPCPETSASFLSQLTFAWLTKLIILGYKRDIEISDLWDLNPREQSDKLVPPFERLWAAEVERCMSKGEEPSVRYKTGGNSSKRGAVVVNERSLLRERPESAPSYTDFFDVTPSSSYRFKSRPSLHRVLWQQFQVSMVICIAQKIISDISLFVSPLILGELIRFISNRSPEREWIGYVLALGLMVSGLLKTIFFATAMYRSWLTGMHIKAVLISAVYNKALRISNESKKVYTQGEIVNLMSVDTQRMQEFMTRVFFGITTPLQIIIALVLIYVTVGASVFTGFVILVLLVPFNGYVAGLQRKFQERNLGFKDVRVKLVNEILNGIKVLKLYAWEPSFEKRVGDIRIKEILYLLKIAILYLVTGLCWNIAPFLVTLATFATFVLSQPNAFLDPSTAFVTLSLFNILRTPMDFLSTMISFSVQANVSLKRINKFLCADEMDFNNVQHVADSAYAIRVENASFSWGATPRPTLSNIQLQIPEGRLVAVVGQVGAGKSSIINAILGEMDKLKGRVTIKGSVAYVAQQAWIQNATVRDNILFNKAYREDKYRMILKACELERDLEILSAGDMTEIGEKGINLSGGQKQRVSVARAVYSDSDVFLLDDPLSAVDSHVGKAIFKNVIGPKGLLQKKTRVLVTHGVHWLPMVDEIVVLMDGRISEVGSYTKLIEHDVREMKLKILEQVEYVTSDGATSGDEIRARLRQKSTGKRKSITLERSVSRDLKVKEKLDASGKVREQKSQGQLISDEKLETGKSQWGSEVFIQTNHDYLLYYGLMGVAQLVMLLVYNYFYWTRMVYAGQKLHDDLIRRLFRAPMAFFDTTPLGRIMNRVSRDIEIVDGLLPLIFRDFLSTFVLVLVTLIVILIQTPIFAAVLVPLCILYYYIQRFYIPTARQVKRIESVTRSPIFSHFSETLSGAATIRAFRATERFIAESKTRVDRNQVFYFASACSLRWLQMNLDGLANVIVFSAAVFELISSSATGGGIAGTLTYMVRQVSEFEANIVSVERLREYSSVETEADWVNYRRRPTPNWPVTGSVVMGNYQTRYRPGLDLVLKGISCRINGGEKIGIVGRTGAGKSSLTLALFRIIEAAGGAIIIDGINIADIGLHDLRSRLTILPQDPVLFSGSLRFNLDPFDQFTDDQVWQALDRAHLKNFVSELPDGLQYECGEEGTNLSVGQRQLVCLARTLLRRTKVLILDEATAAVDMETDTLIQNTIRLAFHNCTIITIAHRLNTIMDYDRVMVMDGGVIKEFDAPETLLADTDSVFHSMAKDAGLV
ncbi:hypothetical protein BaRGS_00027804 [Batillaria attramentaria]|uniref:Uncharacterized protein n=1 Tax=Batillaria attramentaria TaxID=370345 RepID=A0ABD0K1S5_9CAEN